MNQQAMAVIMELVFDECRALRAAAQKEYAQEDSNAFRNFEATAADLRITVKGITPEAVLWVFLNKHLDGIKAWIGGLKSQREDVRGRINDAIVYLCLLRGMIEAQDRLGPELNKLDPGYLQTILRGILRKGYERLGLQLSPQTGFGSLAQSVPGFNPDEVLREYQQPTTGPQRVRRDQRQGPNPMMGPVVGRPQMPDIDWEGEQGGEEPEPWDPTEEI